LSFLLTFREAEIFLEEDFRGRISFKNSFFGGVRIIQIMKNRKSEKIAGMRKMMIIEAKAKGKNLT